jgi:hypothetical protein
MRSILLFLLGVPIPIIILIAFSVIVDLTALNCTARRLKVNY